MVYLCPGQEIVLIDVSVGLVVTFRSFMVHFQGASGRFEQRKQARKEKCELALEGLTCEENLDQLVNLVDDEELELKELQAGPNPLSCSAHLATNGSHGCSLCKGYYPSPSL